MKAELNRFPYLTFDKTSSASPGTPSAGTIRFYVLANGTVAYINSDATTVEVAKVSDVAAASASDRARGNHTGTQPSSTISDFQTAVKSLLGSSLLAGTNITKTVDPGTGNVTISSSGDGTGTTGAVWG